MARQPSISELQKQIAELQSQIKARAETVRSELRAEFDARLSENELSIADIYPELSKRSGKNKKAKVGGTSKVAAKFKDPETGQTWSGRGRTPHWVTGILYDKKMTIEEFKANEAYQA